MKGLIIILSLLLPIISCFGQVNKLALIGSWKLVEYKDSITVTEQIVIHQFMENRAYFCTNTENPAGFKGTWDIKDSVLVVGYACIIKDGIVIARHGDENIDEPADCMWSSKILTITKDLLTVNNDYLGNGKANILVFNKAD